MEKNRANEECRRERGGTKGNLNVVRMVHEVGVKKLGTNEREAKGDVKKGCCVVCKYNNLAEVDGKAPEEEYMFWQRRSTRRKRLQNPQGDVKKP